MMKLTEQRINKLYLRSDLVLGTCFAICYIVGYKV